MHQFSRYQAATSQTHSTTRGESLVSSVAVVLLVAVVGLLLALQGWRSQSPAFDMLTYIHNADNFLKTGSLPRYGDVSSYGSFSPPGTSWLMVPGLLVFSDPRLFEKVGSAALHLGTLLGVFLLARSSCGTRCAYLSVVLYGLSAVGLSFAGSLWPIGHPFFYVWMVYFGSYWVIRRDPRYLSAAIVTWAVGMYVDMAIAPAIAILPVLWLLYRPAVLSRALLVGGILVLAVWYPYLQFEADRGYIDLQSQLLRKSIFPQNYRDTWCDPSLALQNWESISSSPVLLASTPEASHGATSGILRRLLIRLNAIVDGLLSTFMEATAVSQVSVALLFLVLGGLTALGLSGSSTGVAKFVAGSPWGRSWLISLAVGLMLSSALVMAFVISYYASAIEVQGAAISTALSRLQAVLVIGGILLLLRRQIAALVFRLAAPTEVGIRGVEHGETAKIVVISLLIPWLILLLVAEPGRPERFLWLWPLQIVVLAAFVTNVLIRLKVPRIVVWIAQIGVIMMLLLNPLLSRVDPWLRSGWAGLDAEEVQVVDYLAHRLRVEGKDRAAIGYQTFIYSFMPRYNIIDPQYKVGAEFDLLFKYRYGISNTNHCAEGVSQRDEYRVVQTQPKDLAWAERERFNVSLDDTFRMVGQVGRYQVFKRQ